MKEVEIDFLFETFTEKRLIKKNSSYASMKEGKWEALRKEMEKTPKA